MSSAVVVLARFSARSGERDPVAEVLAEMIPRDEPGCLSYALHEHGDDVVVIERWESAEDFDAHLAGPAVATIAARLDGLLTGPPQVKVLRPLSARWTRGER